MSADTPAVTPLSEVDEELLIRRAKAEDDVAFGELVRRYQGRLRAYASRYVTDSNDVYELAQDAFLDAYRHFDRFDPGKPLMPWIRTICRNRILNYFRARRSRKHLNLYPIDDAILDHLHQMTSDDGGMDDRLEALRACLKTLDHDHLQLVRRRYHLATAVKDIADDLSTTPAAVSMMLMRTRNRLRNCMQQRLADHEA